MLRLVGSLDPNFGWANGTVITRPPSGDAPLPRELCGAYACATVDSDGAWIARDPLGINKLFWARGPQGQLLFAARPRRLIDAGCRFADVRAVPAGTLVRLDADGHVVRHDRIRLSGDGPSSTPGVSPEVLAERIHCELDDYVRALARTVRGPVYVCLSGGLDSAGIAVAARPHFPGLRAVSFDLDVNGGASGPDRRAAERLAADLGLPLTRVTLRGDQVLDLLDGVLVEGIDWRDFNVHAALVNAALARAIAGSCADAETPVALTGDLANELLVDYHAERRGERTYYALPRVPPARLRASLVRGLETSHRELGPFLAWGVHVVQPYAVTVGHYLALSEEFLQSADRKERLYRSMFGAAIPDYVYERPKTRAQVGGREDGGVLGLCLERGVDARFLRDRFAALHGVADVTELTNFIRAGRYRAAVPNGPRSQV